ncbi:hypothetical protein CCACVL1_13921 [Corchorus capsularis]|uniref:Uncharacterized protein n=1 Tax=Corchorus capsularis TaxID=210143 RepID=A0A1R3I945_COCAP|nr:hypothetical protein CCACVL1_13921 [Corchorus capsularis]
MPEYRLGSFRRCGSFGRRALN